MQEGEMSDPTILANRYQLGELLGSGGMAVVYRARDLTLERNVALKILRKDFTSDHALRKSFHQEAKAAANLTHHNIVTVHDFGFDSGRIFIVMEYVPGDHLKNILSKHGAYPISEALALISQACAGVGYAHRTGVIHCDIKPHNLLITPDGQLKVADFGIARALASIAPNEKTEVMWGSPQYFSPEQAAGISPSPASDVYSLGVVLYELLTNKLPFKGNSPQELARLHRQALPISPRQFNPAIPSKLEGIIHKSLAKEPSNRYRNANQLGEVINQFVDSELVSRRQDGRLTITEEFTTSNMIISTTLPPSQPEEPLLVKSTREYASEASPERAVPAIKISKDPLDLDWITIALGLLTVVAVGGLIPLFLWVYYLYR
jgi:serine/threonine protein kinase